MTHTHTEDCEWKVFKDGKRRCMTGRNERERTKRQTRLAKIRALDHKDEAIAAVIRRNTPDGFEDEFGAKPDLVEDHEWYDEVIVYRMLVGVPTGRKPYRKEWEDFFRRNTITKYSTLMEITGVGFRTVHDWAKKCGYTWPARLTDEGMGKKMERQR